MNGTPLLLALDLTLALAGAPAVGSEVDRRSIVAEVALAEAAAALDAPAGGDANAAMAHLARVDPGAPNLPAFRRAALEGRALVALGRLAEAVVPLREAAALATSNGAALDVSLELALARAEHANGEHRAALRALRRAGPEVFFEEEAVLVQADSHQRLGEITAAAADLDAGLAALPSSSTLRRARASLLLTQGLSRAAAEDVRALLAAPTAALTADDALVLAGELSAVGDGGAQALAVEVLDSARARHPEDARLPATLARLLREDAPRQAVGSERAAALLDDTHRLDLAELEREAGTWRHALRENAAGGEPAARLRQRLAILVDARAWDRVLALEPRLRAVGLDDAAITYALAYASLQVGDPGRAEALLNDVIDPAWFERATALRAAVASCARTEEPCAP